MIRTLGLLKRHLIISTFCFCPADKFNTGTSRSILKLYFFNISFILTLKLLLSSVASILKFSNTDKVSNKLKCWKTIPILFFLASSGELNFKFFSFKKTSPLSGLITPDKIFTNVDFPAPFSPNSAYIFPLLNWRDTLSLAIHPGYIFDIFDILKSVAITFL